MMPKSRMASMTRVVMTGRRMKSSEMFMDLGTLPAGQNRRPLRSLFPALIGPPVLPRAGYEPAGDFDPGAG